jgi:hypothetical protein
MLDWIGRKILELQYWLWPPKHEPANPNAVTLYAKEPFFEEVEPGVWVLEMEDGTRLFYGKFEDTVGPWE